MRALSLRSIPAALAVLAALAPQPAWCASHYSRQITVGSGLFLGLMKDHPQKGTVTVTSADGKPVGKLTFAGSFVEFQDKGTYNLDFEGDDIDLQFAIVKSKQSTGAFMLNVARTANGLKTTGAWEGDEEGKVTVNEKNGPLVVVD